MEIESSPWVTLHAEYPVVSVLAAPQGRVTLQIVCDDGRSLGVFNAENFMTVDSDIPRNWCVRVGEGGMLEMAPEAWLAPGFWEAYYDGDPAAVDAVAVELPKILGE